MSRVVPPSHEQERELEESFRTLQTKVLLSVKAGQRCFLLTSCLPGEGKTSVAVVLARSMGYTYKVLLVEADLRRPQLHNWFKIRNEDGVTDVYHRAQSSVGISVMPSGTSITDPQHFFLSPAFEQLLLHVRADYDIVLFDAPPVLTVPDALLLASRMDGVIMVLRAGAVTQAEAQEAAKRVRSVGGKLIGCVLIGCQRDLQARSYLADYYPQSTNARGERDQKASLEGV